MNGLRRCGIYTQWNTTQPLKKNKIMPFAATWVEPETLILSEVNQKEKDKKNLPYLKNSSETEKKERDTKFCVL